MVLTKSISRFARNTLDCLKYIRMLKEKGIAVYFQKENINTLDAKGEVMITIMASLAQQESESISKNVKLGIDFRNKQGKVQVNHNRFLGYTKDAEGHLIIDPEQAEVVKRIYRKYLEGASMDMICHGLEADGILTGAGNKKWYTSTVKKILTNEKYIGDALLQKTCTIDILNKTRVANNGIAPQYYVEDDHEAIIPKEIYRKNWYAAGMCRQAPAVKSGCTVAHTAFRRWWSAEVAVKFFDVFTGTTMVAAPLSGGAPAGWNRTVQSAMLGQSMKKNWNRSF